VKRQFFLESIPALFIFLITSAIWIFFSVPFLEFVGLSLGVLFGAFFLELDHIIYWFYRKPNTEEGRLAQDILKKKDLKSFYKLLKITRYKHNNLIFHHYFFQVALNLISLFIFSTYKNSFILSFLFTINSYLLFGEIKDYLKNPKFLQDWLFAREENQLSLEAIKNYLLIFSILLLILFFFLVKSNL